LLLLCANCKTKNQETSNFCNHCGEPLEKRAPVETGSGAPLKKRAPVETDSGKWIVVFLGLLILAAGWVYFFQDVDPSKKSSNKTVLPKSSLSSPEETTLDNQKAEGMAPKRTAVQSSGPVREEAKRTAIAKKISPDEVSIVEVIRLPVGWVVIKDQWGGQVSRILSAVLSGSLIALPTRACLGGDRWLFRSGEKDEVKIERGVWREGDIIGLWYLEGGKRAESPELFPWKEDEPLEWLSLESGINPSPIEVSPVRKQGFFMHCSLPKPLNEPGIFIQRNRVVGWAFGSLLDGGYLWTGPEGKNLDYETRVENFYFITFADGREEQFSRALAMGKDAPAFDRLEAFAEGFRLNPKLSGQDTPSYLHPDSIVMHMRFLIAQLIENGLTSSVADIIDHDVMLEASDPYLLMDVIWSTAKSYGYESALELAENVGEDIKENYGGDIPQLDKLHSQLYKNWIRELLKNRDQQGALQAFERGREIFPDNPEIHLLGVELALAAEDWAEAERLLNVRDYPKSLMDRVRIFSARISKLKGQAGKIVIRFTPGSGTIPVSAVINGTYRLGFFVDTGATMVSVPSSTIEALGIEIDANTPRRKISAVGGIVIAPEVVLSSIEVDSWVIHHVKAVVLDLPAHSGRGLLGLNYLRRFRMELNNEDGILLLEPR
jgi:clan AA aspartic protease (TIGR02281 family)